MKRDLLIRALIRLYPAEFRRRYGAAMLDFHHERARHASLVDWIRIVADHLLGAAAEHVRSSAAARSTSSVSVSTLVHDSRHSMRALARRPAFTVVVVATIA